MLHLLVKEVIGIPVDEGVKEVHDLLRKEASLPGNVIFPLVSSWVPAPCWSPLPLPLHFAAFCVAEETITNFLGDSTRVKCPSLAINNLYEPWSLES